MAIAMLVAGLALLVIGAEALVRGASRLALGAGISPLVIGLTVVAYGTSLPEMVVSVVSASEGKADIAIGNVVGSNIFNVLFILGISALVTPLVVSRQLIRFDVPVMIGVSLLAFGLALDGSIGRVDAAALLVGALVYTALLIRMARRESRGVDVAVVVPAAAGPRRGGRIVDLGSIATGLILLVVGSRWLVAGAVAIAQRFGVSELVIGLTIVAAGTSLPEVATSIVASIRGERDIAVGNVVGSNIFNLLAVLGASGLLAPRGIGVSAAVLAFDLPVMIAVAVACLPIFFTGQVIARWEGAVFLGYYVAYTAYLVLAAGRHEALAGFSRAMMLAVIPLTLLTLVVVTWRSWVAGRRVAGAS